MHAGIPGIGLGGLFFILLTFVMLVAEIVRTLQGRSSLERWRLVGFQTAISSGIILVTVAMLWLLDLLFLDPRRETGSGGANTGAGERFAETASALPLVAAPILGTLALLVIVIVLSETARLFVRRPKARLLGEDE